jgi:oligopeptidase B
LSAIYRKTFMTADLPPLPPAPAVRPSVQDLHGVQRIDPYAYLNERESPAVREHLVAEYAYSDAVMARARVTPNTLYGEFRARLPEAEQQVPVASGDYLYYSRFVPDQAQPVHCRRLAPDLTRMR